MAREVEFGVKTRDVLIQGVNKLANAVRVTIGPKSKNVVLDKSYDASLIMNDGVTVAKKIELEDAFANMGAQLVKGVAMKTNNVAGDDTTTTTVLAQAMINEGVKNIAAGSSPVVLRKDMKKACDKAVETIKEMSQPISGKKQIARVVAISASNDEVDEMVTDVMEKVTNNDVITIEESETMKTELDLVEDMQSDRDYISACVANNIERMEATLEDPYILVTDKKISNIQEVLPLLGEVVKSDAKLLVIAEDVEGEALTTLIVNKLCGASNVVTVKVPGYDDGREEMLQDIAVLTGGTIIDEQLNLELRDTRVAQLGHAKSVKVMKENTVIVNGLGKKAGINARATRVKTQLVETSSEFDKEELREHLVRLSGGVTMIRIGAATETEVKEAKLRIEDTPNTTKAAVEEGIIAGGSTAYINASKEVQKLVDSLEGGEKTGAKIVMKALEAPFSYTAKNAGLEGAVVVNQVKGSKKDIGFNACNEVYANMVREGILDPARVTRAALENATNIASTLLTTESTVATIRESQAAPVMLAGDVGGMM